MAAAATMRGALRRCAHECCRAPAVGVPPRVATFALAPALGHWLAARTAAPRRWSSAGSGNGAGGGVTPPTAAVAPVADDHDDAARPPPGSASAGGIPGAIHGGDKMLMMYTCKVCDTRSARVITKLAYFQGVVLVRCPGCNNLHLVADRLGYFDDNSTDVEALARAKGEVVRRGTLGGGGAHAAAAAGGQALGSVMVGPPPSPAAPAAGDGGGDKYVIELTQEDLAVLATAGKSVNLRTGAEVVDKLEYRSSKGSDGGASGGTAGSSEAGSGARGANATAPASSSKR